MASSCGLRAHPGTFFVKILEQMSMVSLWIIFWAQLQKALCYLVLLSRTISTLTFFPANSTEERKEQVRVTKPNSFIPRPCLQDEERGLGFVILTCSFLSSVELSGKNVKVLIVLERSMRQHKAFCSCAQKIVYKVTIDICSRIFTKNVPG